MGLETCQILGQFSLSLFLLKEKPPNAYVWSGERLTRKTADIQARPFMARALGENGKECQAEGEAIVVTRKTPS